MSDHHHRQSAIDAVFEGAEEKNKKNKDKEANANQQGGKGKNKGKGKDQSDNADEPSHEDLRKVLDLSNNAVRRSDKA